jgi:hypothetical protein
MLKDITVKQSWTIMPLANIFIAARRVKIQAELAQLTIWTELVEQALFAMARERDVALYVLSDDYDLCNPDSVTVKMWASPSVWSSYREIPSQAPIVRVCDMPSFVGDSVRHYLKRYPHRAKMHFSHEEYGSWSFAVVSNAQKCLSVNDAIKNPSRAMRIAARGNICLQSKPCCSIFGQPY